MPKFMVETSHTEKNCLKAMDAIVQYGQASLTRGEWGCKAREHKGWISIEADNAAEARNVVPPQFRNAVKVVPLTTFTADEIRQMQASQSTNMPPRHI